MLGLPGAARHLPRRCRRIGGRPARRSHRRAHRSCPERPRTRTGRSTFTSGTPPTSRAADRPKTVYRSVLPARSCSRSLGSAVVEGRGRDRPRGGGDRSAGGPFPVIVFSHGATNDPIDYAHMLERIAAGGFVVAAPGHTNNTQDDARIDYINRQATAPPVSPRPCHMQRRAARPLLQDERPVSMATASGTSGQSWTSFPPGSGIASTSRARASWGTPAGPSPRWPPPAAAPPGGSSGWASLEPRVKAIMGMAIGAAAITHGQPRKVVVPTVLVAGGKDTTPRPQTVSRTPSRRSRAPTSCLSGSRTRPTAASTRPTAHSCSRRGRRSTSTMTASSTGRGGEPGPGPRPAHRRADRGVPADVPVRQSGVLLRREVLHQPGRHPAGGRRHPERRVRLQRDPCAK